MQPREMQTRRKKLGAQQRNAADGHPEGANPPGSNHWWTAEEEETKDIRFRVITTFTIGQL